MTNKIDGYTDDELLQNAFEYVEAVTGYPPYTIEGYAQENYLSLSELYGENITINELIEILQSQQGE